MVRNMLQRDIKILTYIGLLTHNIEKLKWELVRICIVKPNPLYAFNISHFTNKFSNMCTAIKVYSIISKLLFNNLEFLHALCYKLAHLLKDIIYWPTNMLACNKRNSTISTTTITSFCYLNISIMRRSRQHAATISVCTTCCKGFCLIRILAIKRLSRAYILYKLTKIELSVKLINLRNRLF